MKRNHMNSKMRRNKPSFNALAKNFKIVTIERCDEHCSNNGYVTWETYLVRRDRIINNDSNPLLRKEDWDLLYKILGRRYEVDDLMLYYHYADSWYRRILKEETYFQNFTWNFETESWDTELIKVNNENRDRINDIIEKFISELYPDEDED